MSGENTITQTPEPQQATQPEPQQQPENQQQEPQNAAQQAQAVNPYQSIIDGQNEQIAALIAANEALTKQVTNMIPSGAQLGGAQPVTQTQQAQPTQTFNAPSLAIDEDWSLEGLASEIGRKHA